MRRLILAFFLALWPVHVWAAVAHDADSEGQVNPGTSLTISHTVTGSNTVLYVNCVCEPGYTDVDVLTASYNGVSMPVKFTDTTTSGNRHIRVFEMVAPASGTHNILVEWGALNRAFSCNATSFTGVDQSAPSDAHVLTDGTGGVTSISRTVSSAAGDMVMDTVVGPTSGITFTVNNGNTLSNESTGDFSLTALGASYEAGAASVTVGWAWGGAGISAVEYSWNVRAASAGSAPNSYPRRIER